MDEELKTISAVKQAAITLALQFGPKVVVAILLVIAGIIVGRWVGRISDRAFRRFHVETPARDLLVRIVWVLTIGLFAIMALQNLDVQLLPLIAGLSVAGAGVALAMQGVLGNVMAGLTIIFTKPFRIGEYISIAGEEGQVATISLSSTILHHPDLSQVIIPNRKIVGEILHNYGKIRQLEIAVNVAHDTDLTQALAAVLEVVRDNPRCLSEPSPAAAVTGFSHGAICITARPWTAVHDYAAAAGEMKKAIVEAFRARNIVTRLPQMEVLMLGR